MMPRGTLWREIPGAVLPMDANSMLE